jgi:hypothetical protein
LPSPSSVKGRRHTGGTTGGDRPLGWHRRRSCWLRASVGSTDVTNVDCATCFGPTHRRTLVRLAGAELPLVGRHVHGHAVLAQDAVLSTRGRGEPRTFGNRHKGETDCRPERCRPLLGRYCRHARRPGSSSAVYATVRQVPVEQGQDGQADRFRQGRQASTRRARSGSPVAAPVNRAVNSLR